MQAVTLTTLSAYGQAVRERGDLGGLGGVAVSHAAVAGQAASRPSSAGVKGACHRSSQASPRELAEEGPGHRPQLPAPTSP